MTERTPSAVRFGVRLVIAALDRTTHSSRLSPRSRPHTKIMAQQIASDDESWMDVEFMDSCATDSDPTVRLEDVRAALAKIGGSMDSAIDETRGEW